MEGRPVSTAPSSYPPARFTPRLRPQRLANNGAVARFVARSPGVGEVVGVDPSPALLDRARSLRTGLPGLSFQEADGKALPSPEGAFDVVENFVHDPWLVRRLSALARAAGFDVFPVRSYGIVETVEPSMTPTWVDRGAEARLAVGQIGAELAAALKAEAPRRAAEETWFGYMAYASLIARKPS